MGSSKTRSTDPGVFQTIQRMKYHTRYAFRLAGKLIPAGTRVKVLKSSDARVQAIVPGIQDKEGSQIVAVEFEGFNHATLLHRTQLETA